MKKGLLLTGLCLLMMYTFRIGCAAYQKQADELNDLGLLKGTEKGYELERAPSRVEGAVMLIRLLGKESTAMSARHAHPFSDVPSWAAPYVGYMHKTGLTKGVTPTKFGASDPLDAKSYMTFALRALGYNDNQGDFSWSTALAYGQNLGLFSDEEARQIETNGFLRGNMIWMSRQALDKKVKGQTTTLQEKLLAEGAIKKQLPHTDSLKVKFDPETGWYGYVDANMNWVILPVFTSAEPFSEGYAFVRRPSGSYSGYIDAGGNNVFGRQFTIGMPFVNGKALVNLYGIQDHERGIALVNTKGNVIRTFEQANGQSILQIDESHDDLVYFRDSSNGFEKRFYFSSSHELAPWRINQLADIHQGIAAAVIDVPGTATGMGFALFDVKTGKGIDRFTSAQGKSYPFEEITFSEGIFRIRVLEGQTPRYVYYDLSLKPINNVMYQMAEDFQDGVAVVGQVMRPTDFNREMMYAYLKQDGSYFKDFAFDRASSFHEGYAIVKQEFESLLLNRKGEYTTEPVIQYADGFIMTEPELVYVKAEVARIAKQIAPSSMRVEEKVKAINAYLVNHVAYDHDNFSTEVGDNVPRASYTAFGALKYGIAVCQGYAEAASLIMDAAGIENSVISGIVTEADGKQIGHAWNLVNVNGALLHLDVTWNDGSNLEPYFLISDEEMTRIGRRTW